jgi:phosphoenolpyruvate synthase/pyruvate phosphate dikinase
MRLNVEINSILEAVDHENIHTVEKASEEIRSLILKAGMPKDISAEINIFFKKLGSSHVAIRSSATTEDSAGAAWAGQLESYLNTTEESLLENVKKCWASLFTPRAIFYRLENDLIKNNISVAVVVQKMVESERSGIAFSVHPVTEDRNQLIIEAGLGLGEAIVSGRITPDSYVVEKNPRHIVGRNIQTKKQILSDGEILKLSELILKIEKQFGFPCDIEWAFEKGRFYIVQSRPITTLTGRPFAGKQKKPFAGKFAPEAMEGRNAGVGGSGSMFEGRFMVPMGKRLANVYEASLKVLARSKAWEKEIGAGYKTAVMNSLGEYYVDMESRDKVDGFFKTKDISYAKNYIIKLYRLRDEVSKEIKKDPFQDFTEEFVRMMAYFFIVKSIFEKIYKNSSADDQKIIEKWRNDDSLFEPLDLYYKNNPEKDQPGKSNWSWVFIDGNLKFYDKDITFSNEENKKAELKKAEFKDSNIIKGNPAFPGIVRGAVRLILSPEDKNSIKNGEIIVAPMTTVDFLPFMKKALAFITDEGGITSHAAIVAREMKKPCIIGTKIATTVLKNGDTVEVDANAGTIRILP